MDPQDVSSSFRPSAHAYDLNESENVWRLARFFTLHLFDDRIIEGLSSSHLSHVIAMLKNLNIQTGSHWQSSKSSYSYQHPRLRVSFLGPDPVSMRLSGPSQCKLSRRNQKVS